MNDEQIDAKQVLADYMTLKMRWWQRIKKMPQKPE